MTKHNTAQEQQHKQIDRLFGDRFGHEIQMIESKRNVSCDVHGRRRDSFGSSWSVSSRRGSNHNLSDKKEGVGSSILNNHYNWNNAYKKDSSTNSTSLYNLPGAFRNSLDFSTTVNRHNSVNNLTNGNGNKQQGIKSGHETLSRRTSAPAINQSNNRRNSWNDRVFKGMEHPSAFPSMLRSSTTSLNDVKTSNQPQHQQPYNPYPGRSSISEPRQTKTSIIRRNSTNNVNVKKNYTNNVRTNPRPSSMYRQSPARSLYNLQTSTLPRETMVSVLYKSPNARDFVNEKSSNLNVDKTKKKAPNSILRNSHKSDEEDLLSGKETDSKLSKENLSKHVRIFAVDSNDLSNESSNEDYYRRESFGSLHSYNAHRKMSIDSLDCRRSSISGSRRASIASGDDENFQNAEARPKFVAVTALEDVQAVRCAEFHPNGKVYAVGSNSKTFRICEYPSLAEIREEHTTYQPTVLFKRTKHHKGSIYCMAWSPQGDLVATGSNDKTVKLMRYNEVQKQLEGREIELTMHDGTVRDLCFIEDSTNKASLLISGGAGDCKIYVTDCATSTPFQALSGHGSHVLSLYNWGGAMFVSGSQDKTVRFWDLRTRGCVNMVTPATTPGSRIGSPVAAVCVDPSGRLLVSGHEDSSCVLYDIRGNRPIQCFKPHASDIRSIRFSPSAYYLLTAGYDNKLVLTDLQGDLTMPLPSVVVAQHSDKVISGRWHPTDFSFLSTSADKTATLWALPPI